MKLSPEQQDEIVDDGNTVVDGETFTLIDEEQNHTSRWSKFTAVTFSKPDGSLWQFLYEEPLTEMQDVELDIVEAYPVEAQTVATVTYRRAA